MEQHVAHQVTLTELLRRKEAAVGFVLEQVHEAPITVIDKKSIRSMAICDVLNMTKSDRTQQMLNPGFRCKTGKHGNASGNHRVRHVFLDSFADVVENF